MKASQNTKEEENNMELSNIHLNQSKISNMSQKLASSNNNFHVTVTNDDSGINKKRNSQITSNKVNIIMNNTSEFQKENNYQVGNLNNSQFNQLNSLNHNNLQTNSNFSNKNIVLKGNLNDNQNQASLNLMNSSFFHIQKEKEKENITIGNRDLDGRELTKNQKENTTFEGNQQQQINNQITNNTQDEEEGNKNMKTSLLFLTSSIKNMINNKKSILNISSNHEQSQKEGVEEELKIKINQLEKVIESLKREANEKNQEYMKEIERYQSILTSSNKWEVVSLNTQIKELEARNKELKRMNNKLILELNNERKESNMFKLDTKQMCINLNEELNEIKEIKQRLMEGNACRCREIGQSQIRKSENSNNNMSIRKSNLRNNDNHEFKIKSPSRSVDTYHKKSWLHINGLKMIEETGVLSRVEYEKKSLRKNK